MIRTLLSLSTRLRISLLHTLLTKLALEFYQLIRIKSPIPIIQQQEELLIT